MATSGIEIEIQQLLRNIGEPALVADELLKKWHRGELSDSDVERVAHFLIAFGFHNAFADNLAIKIKEKSQLPWSAIARLLLSVGTKPNKEIIDQLFIGASEQDALDSFVRDSNLDKIDQRFGKIRSEMLGERKKAIDRLKQNYIDQATIFRNDRFYDKELDCIERLLRYFPNDFQIKELYADCQTRKALNKLQRKTDWILEEESLFRKDQQLPIELQSTSEDIAKLLLTQVEQNPTLSYNIALALYQMGNIKAALEALEKAPNTLNLVWLKIDLLMEAHRYVEVLSLLNSIEKSQATDPDATFAVHYQRAKALWGLHQHNAAIEILENLVKVRPDYRSAHALLNQWREVVE